jgi:peroxiredoxin Q/BCP
MEKRKDLIPIKQEAPDFTLKDELGTNITLSSLRGKNRVVLIFYPADGTPTCTAQLCAAADARQSFESVDAIVFGVNPAPPAKHKKFAAKHSFPFSLLADDKGQVAEQYGCKGLFGVNTRTVYVVNKLGKVGYARRGNPAPAELVNAIRNMNDAG